MQVRSSFADSVSGSYADDAAADDQYIGLHTDTSLSLTQRGLCSSVCKIYQANYISFLSGSKTCHAQRIAEICTPCTEATVTSTCLSRC